MHPRRIARESILGALYAFELTGEEKTKVLLDLFERNSFCLLYTSDAADE